MHPLLLPTTRIRNPPGQWLQQQPGNTSQRTLSYTLQQLLICSSIPPPFPVHMPSANMFDANLTSRAYGAISEPQNLEQTTAERRSSGPFPPPPPIPSPARNESFSQSPLKLGIMKSLLDFDLRHKPMNATSRERRRTTLLPAFLQSTIHGSPPGSPINNNRAYFK